MNWMRKIMRDITQPEKSSELKKWQKKYVTARTDYSEALEEIKRYEKMYEGDRHVNRNPNKGGGMAPEVSLNVRNITFDLVESEVESSIPYPKIIPIHEEDVEAAKAVEAFLRYYIEKLHLRAKNDVQERTTPVAGGCYDFIEWDNTKKTHKTVGDLNVEGLHPEEVIPQPGVTSIEKMDYFFIRKLLTRDYIERRFGVSVKGEEPDSDLEDKTHEDVVELVTAYYRNKDNGIGLFRWCGDVVVEEMDDYEARYIKKCKKCGATVVGDVCEECGSKSFETVKDEMDHITVPINTGEVNPDGTPIIQHVEIELPYYKPHEFPIVLRKNISRYKSLLGFSDAAAIEDQQDTIKKLGSKANEKLLKGGSIMTLPEGLPIDTTDREFKLVRIKNPQQMSMISVQNCQADISKDLQYLEINYQWAKSALGITDAYQGKYDSSATSGTAKQYSINQAAGRLESKRVMKNEAYAKLYEKMFKYVLAYADQPIPINMPGKDGELEFSHFDKSDFIKFDDEGHPYWNDEFLFTIDATSTLLTNQEAMWQQIDMKYQSGAFGQPGTLESMQLLWLELERTNYPHAGEILAQIEKRIADQKEQALLQQQMNLPTPPMEGVTPNDMSEMQL